jgi:hypothetical protein
MANIDTKAVPDKLTAPWFKRFFKERFGIPVRVQSRGYIQVWIQCRQVTTRDIVYDHEFSPDLGSLCLDVIYGDDFDNNSWAGNVQKTGIAMVENNWRSALQRIIDGELNKDMVSATAGEKDE